MIPDVQQKYNYTVVRDDILKFQEAVSDLCFELQN